jgi:Conjugal transfer/entry exclusion protein
MLKKIILVGVLGLSTIAPINSFAVDIVNDPMVDADLIHKTEDLMNRIDGLKKQFAQLAQSSYKWGDASNLINQLADQVNQVNSLAYSAQNIGGQFQQAFPGYQPSQDYNQQYKDNLKKTMATIAGVMQSLGLSASSFTDEQSRMQYLQSQVQNAQGQTQAIQASAEIATETLSQLQLMRQTMMAQTNAQEVYYANNLQNKASHVAQIKAAIDKDVADNPPVTFN